MGNNLGGRRVLFRHRQRGFHYNDRRFRQSCALSTSSLTRRIFSTAERRASSQAASMFFRCSTRFAFAIAASSDFSVTAWPPWYVRSDELTCLIGTVSNGIPEDPRPLLSLRSGTQGETHAFNQKYAMLYGYARAAGWSSVAAGAAFSHRKVR
jgi:hypothetical protein